MFKYQFVMLVYNRLCTDNIKKHLHYKNIVNLSNFIKNKIRIQVVYLNSLNFLKKK